MPGGDVRRPALLLLPEQLLETRGDPQATYRYLTGTNAEIFVVLDDAYRAHIGDIDVHQGGIFAAMEQPSGVLEVTLGGEVKGVTPLKSRSGAAPPHGDLPSSAVNP